ncbi:MAG TPA: dTMP kinase [Actinomycetales bacterium]|nr:dTMP kinase [Actinomycetales bacterium]
MPDASAPAPDDPRADPVSATGAVPSSPPEAPDHDVRAVLAITPFRRLWLALGLSSFGDWLGLLATTSLASALATGTSAKLLAVSGVFILRLAPAVVFGPLAGVVADRLNRRWTLVYGDVLRFALFCTIPMVGTLWWLFVATILIEVVGLFWMPAKEATVPNLVPRKRLEAANQLSLVVTYGSAPVAAVAFLGVTLLNGVLDNVIPPLAGDPTYLALYLNAATYLVSALVIWRLDFPKPTTHLAREQSIWRTALEGWRYVGHTPLVRGLVLGMLGAFAAGGFVIGLARAFVYDLGAGSPGYGTLFAAVFLGLALGMWVGPRLLSEFSRRRLFGLSIAVAGVWLVLLSLVPNIVLAVFFTVGLGFCAGLAWVTGYTLLGLEVGDEVRGRTFAFLLSMVRVVLVSVLAIGPAVAALLSATLGLPHTLHLNDEVSLTYTGVMATFLLAGLMALTIGVVSLRAMDDGTGPSLRAELLEALRVRQLDVASPRQASMPGRFVAFEGGDGSGKSTQVRLLGAWLRAQGYETVVTHEPGATETGERLREVLLGGADLVPRAEALLFAADRAHHVETVVRPALLSGAVVVTDRYVDSSIAYQGAGRALASSEVAKLSRWATQGLVPDLTVVLDVDPGLGRQRRGDEPDRLESEPHDFHVRVRDRFRELAQRAPSRYLLVDGSSDPDEIAGQVRARLVALLPESPVAREARLAREAQQRADAEARARQEAADRLVAERREHEAAAERQRELAGRAAREAAELEARERAERDRAEARRVQDEQAAAERAARAQAEAERTAQAVRERASDEVGRLEANGRALSEAVDRRSEETAELPVVERTAALPASRPEAGEQPGGDASARDRRDHETQQLPAVKPALDDEIFGASNDRHP